MPVYPTEGANNKCEDCKLLCDHITKSDAWILKNTDLISKIPSLCKSIEKIENWIATWPKEHMGFALQEIEKDESWKRNMETKLTEKTQEIKDDVHSRFDKIKWWMIGNLATLCVTLLVLVLRTKS